MEQYCVQNKHIIVITIVIVKQSQLTSFQAQKEIKVLESF